jgi:hypothetical protein
MLSTKNQSIRSISGFVCSLQNWFYNLSGMSGSSDKRKLRNVWSIQKTHRKDHYDLDIIFLFYDQYSSF